MVQFNKGSFTITVPTHYPVQDYLNIASGLIELLQAQDINVTDKPVYPLALLKAMLPSEADAEKMVG